MQTSLSLVLPHSDPVADGPTIQAAAQRAIAAGMNTDVYFETIARADVRIPKIFMGYYNMIYARGLDKFVKDCVRSGITGMIVPDLPLEEAAPLKDVCLKFGIDLIFLVAPNTPQLRLKMIEEETSGFLYLVARSGVTGVRSDVLRTPEILLLAFQGISLRQLALASPRQSRLQRSFVPGLMLPLLALPAWI